MDITLRPYQIDGIQRIRDAYRCGRRAPLYVLPTGGGKTYTFAYITARMGARGKRVTILVHRESLLSQCHRALDNLGVPHGIIAAGRTPQAQHRVQVASVHTLTRRIDHVSCPDLYIIDEAHHVRARTWARIIEEHRDALLLGVTATPCRTDGSGLGVSAGGFFDEIILGPSVRQLTTLGYLAPYVYYAPPTDVDLSAAPVRAGDFDRKYIDSEMRRPAIIGCAVDHYRRICGGAPAIAFCVSVDHAEEVASQFRIAGFRAQAVHAKMGKDAVAQAIEDLGTGKIDILSSCDLISEGTDIPVVAAAILLRPTWSTGLYLQQVGRVLRPAPGKSHAIILDHVGNVLRHGLPDDERDWSLDAERREIKRKNADDEQPPAVRQCPQCYTCHRPMATCPRCGYVYRDVGRKVEQKDGELSRIDPETMEKMRKKRRVEQGRARSLSELLQIAKNRGYSPRWAYTVWRARQKKASGGER